MSTRAIQRLREEQNKQTTIAPIDEESSDEEDSCRNKNAFCFDNDESDSESEESDIDESESDESKSDNVNTIETTVENNNMHDKDEDIDAILEEFKLTDDQQISNTTSTKKDSPIHSILLEYNFNMRNFDLDYTLQSLLGGVDTGNRNNRNIKRKYLFGGDSNHRPPHYIGGGMGMKESTSSPELYKKLEYNDVKWYEFQYSDVYASLESEYQSLTSSGDINLLALFLADHPFHSRSLLQLSTVLYKTGDADKGKDLLQRCLQIYECAGYHSIFYPNKSNTTTVQPFTIAPIFMDIGIEANEPFFVALFRYMQISCMNGCIPTSFVVARLLLALDPLRDPMGVLLVLDYYALACGNEEFLIRLVDSNAVKLYHEDCEPCPLLELPNFAYSYALALFRLKKERADEALRNAIQTYPSIVTTLLKNNNINVNSRSTRMDWGGVIPKLPNNTLLISHPVLQKIIDIFIMKQTPLWSSDVVLQWLYENCDYITSTTKDIISETTTDISAINRYQSCDPSDYSNTTTTLPAEFNPLDERLVAPALVIDPNRRRLLRQHVQQQQWQDPRLLQQRIGDGYNAIDPDDPMMEVFLRSLLPWNSVQGVPRRNV